MHRSLERFAEINWRRIIECAFGILMKTFYNYRPCLCVHVLPGSLSVIFAIKLSSWICFQNISLPFIISVIHSGIWKSFNAVLHEQKHHKRNRLVRRYLLWIEETAHALPRDFTNEAHHVRIFKSAKGNKCREHRLAGATKADYVGTFVSFVIFLRILNKNRNSMWHNSPKVQLCQQLRNPQQHCFWNLF